MSSTGISSSHTHKHLMRDVHRSNETMRRVLMIAFHFPPLAGSSGIQRTLRFVQHLPQFGWQPIVLTATPMAYERTSDDLRKDVPAGTVVRRAVALDTARHLSLGSRYVARLARPDRWVSWKFDAVRQGLKLIREFRPQALWSTYPIATAHLIGAELQRRSGLPWLADFRDPMAQDGYPADPLTWRAFHNIESTALDRAGITTFTTPGAARVYQQRYPACAHRVHVLENGYDEESFAEVERSELPREPLNEGRLTLLHSGIVYPSERDPAQLFAALSQLAATGALQAGDLIIRFRGAVHDQMLHRLASEHGVEHFVETLPPIDYHAALQEMLRAEALLVLQASNCNEQIPAKIYEYLRAGRPMICLTDPLGDTAGVLRNAGIDSIARLDSSQEIAQLLPRFLEAVRTRQARLPDAEAVRQASRVGRAEALAGHLSQLAR